MRVKALIAYDGSAYYGFQKQNSTKQTISYAIENALHSLHIYADIIGSGRTDAGVHATGQIIHFDLPQYWHDLKKLKQTLNQVLTDIYFKHIMLVPNDFHARFWAKKRVYRYVFKIQKPSVFEQKYIAYYTGFDPTLLTQALQCFKGKHDFNFFRKTGTDTQNSIREVYQAKYIQRQNYHFIYFQANGFLRAQIRMMIDASMLYAKGKLSMSMLQKQLDCHTKYCTNLAPSQGLYLARIIY